MFSRKEQTLDRAKRRDQINEQNIVQLKRHIRVYTLKHWSLPYNHSSVKSHTIMDDSLSEIASHSPTLS